MPFAPGAGEQAGAEPRMEVLIFARFVDQFVAAK